MADNFQFAFDDYHPSDFDLLAEILNKPPEPPNSAYGHDESSFNFPPKHEMLMAGAPPSRSQNSSFYPDSHGSAVTYLASSHSLSGPNAHTSISLSQDESQLMRSGFNQHPEAAVSSPYRLSSNASLHRNIGLQQQRPISSIPQSQPSNFYQMAAVKFRPTKLFTQQTLNADGTTKQSIVIVDLPDGANTSFPTETSQKQSVNEAFSLNNPITAAAHGCKTLANSMEVDELVNVSTCDTGDSVKTARQAALLSPMYGATVDNDAYTTALPGETENSSFKCISSINGDETISTLSKVPEYLLAGRCRLPSGGSSGPVIPTTHGADLSEPLLLNKIPSYCSDSMYCPTKKGTKKGRLKPAPVSKPTSTLTRTLSRSSSGGSTKNTVLSDRKKAAMEKAVSERRIVFVGGVPFNRTPADLRSMFQCYGEIETTSVHFREKGDNYGFVTFVSAKDAQKAIQDDKYSAQFTLCFGGRRRFCKTDYADLDGCTAVKEEYARRGILFSEKSF